MNYQLDLALLRSIFAVPTEVVDNHIQSCSGSALKLLLVLLRQGGSGSVAALSQATGLPQADVRGEMQYWVQAGAVRCEEQDGEPQPAGTVSYSVVSSPTADVPQQSVVRKISARSSRPRLNSSEIAQLAQTDRQISALLQEAQEILGKLLNPSQTEALVSLYTYGGLPVDVILMVIRYCCDIGKSNMRYIETVAYEWLDRGIDTHEKAEEHILALCRKNQNEALIRSTFGLRNRSFSTRESGYIEKWFGTFQDGIDLIRLAYERTVDATGDFSFPYCDKILTAWHEAGIRTVDAAREETSRKPAGTAPQRAPRSPVSGTTGAESGGRKGMDAALELLAQWRAQAREEAQRRLQEVYTAIPRIKQIDTALAKTGFEIARTILTSGEHSQQLLQELREKNLTLQQEKEHLLSESGLGKDYLDTPYHCRTCEDTGYVDGAMCSCLKELLK